MSIVSSKSSGSNSGFARFNGRSGGGSANGARYRSLREVYGPQTVWRNGVAYPNSHWAEIEVVPVEDPANPGRWIHPDRLEGAKRQDYRKREDRANKNLASQREPDISEGPSNAGYVSTRAMSKGNTGRSVKPKVSSAVTGGLNKASGAFNNEASNLKKGATSAGTAYKNSHWKYNKDSGKYEYTGNVLGETAARLGGAASKSAVANAARNEVSNIRGGASAAMDAYDAAHRQRTYTRDKNGNMVYTGTKNTGNAVGRTLAGVGGGVANSAVGRAGKAAFEAITSKIDDFKKGIEKYLTGKDAKSNRSKVLKDLQTKAGNLMGAISSALGSSEGRSRTLGNIQGAISGTIGGIASGIRNSDIGKAAYNAGRNAYGAVRTGLGNALNSIKDFFSGRTAFNKKAKASAVGA